MNLKSFTKAFSLLAITGALSMAATPAQAQSTEEALGAIIGGTAGAIIGGELDKKGSNDEGKIIGAVVGGSLGYIIGNGLDNDDEVRRRHTNQSGEYYRQDGRAYRRYKDPQYGFVSIRIGNGDPYYYSDGRKKSHPVFGQNPGKAKGHRKGHKKNRY